MKKLGLLMLVMVLVLVGFASVASADASATILSTVMPGTGEWYNSGFQGGFPWGECIVSYICPCFWASSILDASSGASTSNMRLDFWTAPGSK